MLHCQGASHQIRSPKDWCLFTTRTPVIEREASELRGESHCESSLDQTADQPLIA